MLSLRKLHLNLGKYLLSAAAFALAVLPAALLAQTEEPAAQPEVTDNATSETATTTALPAIQLQYASVVSAGSTFTISRAPVYTSTGALVYEDISLQLAVGANGQITIAAGYPKYVVSPALLTSGFAAGTYVGPEGVDKEQMGFVLTGPGIGAGVTEWTIKAAPTYDPCTSPGDATFWVGPLANSPIAARLKQYNITSTDWSYGITGVQNCYQTEWGANTVMGLSRVGNTITVGVFSEGNLPSYQYTYTLK